MTLTLTSTYPTHIQTHGLIAKVEFNNLLRESFSLLFDFVFTGLLVSKFSPLDCKEHKHHLMWTLDNIFFALSLPIIKQTLSSIIIMGLFTTTWLQSGLTLFDVGTHNVSFFLSSSWQTNYKYIHIWIYLYLFIGVLISVCTWHWSIKFWQKPTSIEDLWCCHVLLRKSTSTQPKLNNKLMSSSWDYIRMVGFFPGQSICGCFY